MIKRFEQYVNENLTSLVGRYKNNAGIRKEDEVTEDFVRSQLGLETEIRVTIELVNGEYCVDIDGDVILDDKFYDKYVVDGKMMIGYKLRKVTGDFDCSALKLTTLEGSPEYVFGTFNCEDNNLTSLIGGPRIVGYRYVCSDNNLTSLDGAPESCARFLCSDNFLTSLVGLPKLTYDNATKYKNNTNNLTQIGCRNNKLKDLVGCPETVGNFSCEKNEELLTLKGAPRQVTHLFRCVGCPNLKDISDFPKEVGCLNIDKNFPFSVEEIQSLPGIQIKDKIEVEND